MIKGILKYPVIILILAGLLTLVSMYGLTKIEIDNDMSKMLPDDNPVYLTDENIKDIYGVTDNIFIGVKSKRGTLLTTGKLSIIEEITRKIEEMQYPDEQTEESLSEDSGELPDSTEQSPDQAESDYDDLFSTDSFESSDSPDTGTENTSASTETAEIKGPLIDEVLSIANIEVVEGINGGLEPVSLEDYIPQTDEEIALYKEKLLSWDVFEGAIYSRDFRASTILVSLGYGTSQDEHDYAFNQINTILEEYSDSDLEFYLAGDPVVKTTMNSYITKDLSTLVPIVVLVLLVILFIAFRNLKGVVLPLFSVVIATIWTMGLMGLMGAKITMIGVIIPVLLIAIGSAYGIHLITHYFEEINGKTELTKEEHFEIVVTTVEKMMLPIFLTALTTFFGFLSLVSIKLIPLKNFGIFSAIGVLLEFVLSILLIPAILLIFKSKPKKSTEDEGRLPFIEELMLKLARFLKNKKYAIIVGFIVFIAILVYGTTKINVDFNSLKFFKPDSSIVKSNNFLKKNLSGADVLYINIMGKEDGDLAHPDILKAMDELDGYLRNKYPEVGNINGFHNLIKRMNQVMHYPEDEEYYQAMESSISYNELMKLLEEVKTDVPDTNPSYTDILEAVFRKYNYNGQNYYEIPADPEKYNIGSDKISQYAEEIGLSIDDLDETDIRQIKKKILKQLITQYLLLFSGDLNDLIASDVLQPQMALVTITLKTSESSFIKEVTGDIDNFIKTYFPEGYTAEFGGQVMVTNELNEQVLRGQIISFLAAILVVFLIMFISFKSGVAGLIGVIPLITSILLNFAIMGLFNIDLNITTALIASLAIGIGVDYTIHFISSYKHEMVKYQDYDKALEATFLSSGKAILYNALSVGLGFLVLMFSNIILLGVFGILICVVMISSAIAALTILPVIMEVFRPKFVKKR